MSVTVSVGISTLDRPDALERCLRSLADGNDRPEQVVVVDQSTDDRSQRVSERFAQALPLRYVRQEGAGLGRSQNEVVRHAIGDIVAIIDDDCIADASWLATIRRAFQAGDVDVLAGRVLPQEPVGDAVHPVSSRTSSHRRDFRGYAAPWLVGSGNNFAVRREWFERVGGADERLGPGSAARGGVDMDLFYRLLRAGARVRYDPDVVVHHERQRYEDRKARRPMYGRGMGASIGRWMRRGDSAAFRMLADWVVLRTRLAGSALLSGDTRAAGEEVVMLSSTLGGLIHGLRLPDDPPRGK